MRSFFRSVPAWVLAASTAATLDAASFVPPASLAELALRSEAVVFARAERSSSRARGAMVFTDTELTVEIAFRGHGGGTGGGAGLVAGSRIVVETPGGSTGDQAWMVAGSPRFVSGEAYLLCLARKSDGGWIPTLLSYGLLREIEGEGGVPLLVPLEETDLAGALERPDGVAVEPIVPFERDLLLDHLARVLAGASAWDSSAARASAELIPAGGQGGVRPAQCAFFDEGGRTLRWQTFDTSGSATLSADSRGDPSLVGNALRVVQESMDVWMQIPRSSVNLVFGGAVDVRLNCASADSVANTIVFNDPCNDMEALQGCTGVLAFGGPLASGSTHAFDGASWLTVNGWIMVVNNGSGCIGEANYRLMMAHEMGHGLGFGHVNDSNALMFASCCHTPDNTDLTCLRYTYPAKSATNLRPVVDAGEDVALTLAGNSLHLKGTATDDGLPTAPGRLATQWKQLAGPKGARFASASALETTVTFPASGTYLLGLSAFDGELVRVDVLQATVVVSGGAVSVATFRQRENGYTGTVDTFLQQATPAANNARATELSADSDDPSGSGQASEVLLRFDGIFGPDADQVPPGADITSAFLDLTTTNNGNGARLHRMTVAWDDAKSWGEFGGNGIQAGSEALAGVDATAAGTAATERVDVTTSLAAWSKDPCSNLGWALLPVGTDGWDFYSAEGAEPPRLTVEYSRSAGEPLVANGATWRIWKGSSPPPAGWNGVDLDDSAWASGPTTIGYGDGDDATELEDMKGAYASVFLRTRFEVEDPAAVPDLVASVIHDDGAVVYLNGTELGRANMPAGAVTSTTLASSSIEATATQLRVPRDLLRAGTNVLAASVHNSSVDSSDLSFSAVLFPSEAPGSVACDAAFQRGDVSGDGRINLTDAVTLLDYLFRGSAAPRCADAADADDNGRLILTDAVAILNSLFKGTGPLPAPGAVCGADPTADDLGDCTTDGCKG